MDAAVALALAVVVAVAMAVDVAVAMAVAVAAAMAVPVAVIMSISVMIFIVVMSIMVIIIMVVMMIFFGGFDGGNPLAGVDHHQILVVSGADQIIEEFLNFQTVLDQNSGTSEVGKIRGCGLKIVGPQVGWDQGCDLCAIAGNSFCEQGDRQERGDHFQALALG